jgi:glyoxylase-like metal-dependent hydrolase (beta-lactamase superfamily II)
MKLFFATDTALLSKFEYVMDYAGLGDAVVEYVYTAYRQDPTFRWVPARYKILLNRKAFREIEITEMVADAARTAAAFQVPAQLASFIRPMGEVSEVAKGVFVFLAGSLNPMFVEFKDFVLAIEAPAQAPVLERVPADLQTGSDQPSETFIRKIKETIPNKPIRYLAVTHFHNDHAGGARAFIAEGATILTTPGNKLYFQKFAKADFTLIPDRLARETRPATIETFEGKRVITDGEQTVELINVGSSPHAKENVVAYLPKQKILFQGDLFYFGGFGQFPAHDPSRDRVMKFFGRWLVRNKLQPEQIYGFHDHGFATMTQVYEILRLKRTSP